MMSSNHTVFTIRGSRVNSWIRDFCQRASSTGLNLGAVIRSNCLLTKYRLLAINAVARQQMVLVNRRNMFGVLWIVFESPWSRDGSRLEGVCLLRLFT